MPKKEAILIFDSLFYNNNLLTVLYLVGYQRLDTTLGEPGIEIFFIKK